MEFDIMDRTERVMVHQQDNGMEGVSLEVESTGIKPDVQMQQECEMQVTSLKVLGEQCNPILRVATDSAKVVVQSEKLEDISGGPSQKKSYKDSILGDGLDTSLTLEVTKVVSKEFFVKELNDGIKEDLLQPFNLKPEIKVSLQEFEE